MTSEKTLQNEFARQVEVATSRKVLTWNQAMNSLKGGTAKVRTGHLQILMESDPTKGIVGLVEGIRNVNRETFERLRAEWTELAKNPKNRVAVAPSLDALVRKAAEKLADLWEKGVRDPKKTGAYRILLAYGGGYAWQARSSALGGPNIDPRNLGPGDFAGWPKQLTPVFFQAVHAQEALPFLDLGIPEWIESEKKINATQQAEKLRRWAPRNAYSWIREFLVETTGGREERADFTMFVHGLPILWVEMKIKTRGLAQAARDFLEKDTYKTAPIRLLVDGNTAILTAMGEGLLEKWYVGQSPMGHPGPGMPVGGNTPGIQGGQAYLVEQILTQPERFEFLIRRCGYFDGAGHFMVPRSQQYEALANFWRDLLWSACAGQDITDRLVRHTQRTGKTSTMIRAIRMALSERGPYESAFDLSLLMVGETTIIDQIAKTFLTKNTGLLDASVAVDEIKSRKGLREALAKQHGAQSAKRVVLANTQKLESLDSDSMTQDKLGALLRETGADQGKRLRSLVVLDEGHLSQHGGMANMRRLLLPHATHLLLTATPKAQMAQYYGLSKREQILDDFGFHEAREAGIVVPVLFERRAMTAQVSAASLDALAQALGKPTLDALDAGELENDEDLLSNDLLAADRKTRKALVKGILDKIDADLIQTRLDSVIQRTGRIEDSLRNSAGVPLFHPKAMIFCRSVEQARRIISWIQERNKEEAKENGTVLTDFEMNLYRNKRFGVDVSNFGSGDKKAFSALNPGVSNPKTIKERFESEDPDTRIDILLAVGKYTKGYDNADLCLVALLKAIQEPSLINQVYTRPATKRSGKASGVCLDLTLGSTNVESWKSSMNMYDRAGTEHFYDQEGCQTLMDTLHKHLEGAAQAISMNWTVENMGEGATLGWAIDQLDRSGLGQASLFVHHVDLACETIEKLPDAVVLQPLQMPLLGMKYILGKVRVLFPELDRAPASGVQPQEGEETNADQRYVHVIDPQTLGEKIDKALDTLGTTSLMEFLNLSQLDSYTVEATQPDSEERGGGDLGSQALADKRMEHAIQTSIATARNILNAVGGKLKDPEAANDDDHDEQETGQENPQNALRRALEVALERLLGVQAVGGPSARGKRQQAEQALAQVHSELRALLGQQAGGDFITLLTHEIREELRRRWTLLGLPADGLALFEPLVRVAGARWGQDFNDWRARSGHHVRTIDPSDLVSMWVQGEHAHSTSLSTWLGVCSQEHPEWQASFVQFVGSQNLASGLLRAAMGDSSEADATQGQAGLLDVAAREAGRKLSLLETSQDWFESVARHAA